MAATSDASTRPRRAACDRCRSHKLRCERSSQSPSNHSENPEPCIRCARAGATCKTSPPLRLGRPPRQLEPWMTVMSVRSPTAADQQHQNRQKHRRQQQHQHQQQQQQRQHRDLSYASSVSSPSGFLPELEGWPEDQLGLQLDDRIDDGRHSSGSSSLSDDGTKTPFGDLESSCGGATPLIWGAGPAQINSLIDPSLESAVVDPGCHPADWHCATAQDDQSFQHFDNLFFGSSFMQPMDVDFVHHVVPELQQQQQHRQQQQQQQQHADNAGEMIPPIIHHKQQGHDSPPALTASLSSDSIPTLNGRGANTATAGHGRSIRNLSSLMSNLSDGLEEIRYSRAAPFSVALKCADEFLEVLDSMTSSSSSSSSPSSSAPSPLPSATNNNTVASDEVMRPTGTSQGVVHYPTLDASHALLLLNCYIKLVSIFRFAYSSYSANKGNRNSSNTNGSDMTGFAAFDVSGGMGAAPTPADFNVFKLPFRNRGLHVSVVIQMTLYVLGHVEDVLKYGTKDTAVEGLVQTTMRLEDVQANVAALMQEMRLVGATTRL